MSTFVAKSNGLSKELQTACYVNPAYTTEFLNGQIETERNNSKMPEFFMGKVNYINGGAIETSNLIENNFATSRIKNMTESQESYDKNSLTFPESFLSLKNKFNSTSDVTNVTNVTQQANNKPTSRANFIDPSPSGITRIYINHLSSSNNVGDKIRDVNEKLRVAEANSSHNSIKFNEEKNGTNLARKDNSTSPIKIYEPKSNEIKMNYSDFNLIAPKTQDAFTQIELSQIINSGEKVSEDIMLKQKTQEPLSKSNKEENLRKKDLQLAQENEVLEKNVIHKEKPNLEKSKTVIVNVTPQPMLRAQEEDKEADSQIPASKIVSNLKKTMEFKPIDSVPSDYYGKTSNLVKEVYLEENKYDIKNDQTPVSVSSNNNKPKTNNSMERIFIESTQNDQLFQSKEDDLFLVRNTKNDQIIFPSESSSYYNDVNKRHQMTQSQEIESKRLSNAEVIRINDESYDRNSKNDSDLLYNPFKKDELMDNQSNIDMKINKLSQLDDENSNLNVAQRPLSTFYDGSKVWTTSLSTANIVESKDNQKVEKVFEKTGSSKEISQLPKESNLSKKSLRKNLKVKIKLPIENMTKIPPKKERKIQKCCLVLFLLCLFILATSILIYFFASGLITKRISI